MLLHDELSGRLSQDRIGQRTRRKIRIEHDKGQASGMEEHHHHRGWSSEMREDRPTEIGDGPDQESCAGNVERETEIGKGI